MPSTTDYSVVNDVVNEILFSGRYCGLPIYLDLEDELADELAARLSINRASVTGALSSAVAETLRWTNRENIYSSHSLSLAKWQQSTDKSPPPFTALLLCLSVASARMREDQDFAANNYYRRLLEVLGAPHGATELALDALRTSAPQTERYWEALNSWLIETDYVFGQPTATSYSANTRYVSYAVSQSLVREVDRQHLKDMLILYGLSRKNRVAGHEMTLYIDRWMGTAGPTQALRRAWGRKDQGVKARIAEIALAELEQVDEREPAHGPDRHVGGRLSWVLVERDAFPRVQLRLYLAINARDRDLGELTLLGAGENGAVTGLGFSPLLATDLQYLGPVRMLSLERLLLASVAVRSASGEIFAKDARPILSFYRPEDAPYLQESPRVLAFTRHVIMCHDSWRDRVRDHLRKYAAPGFLEVTGAQDSVPPPGWVAFRNVSLSTDVHEEIAKELQVLVPMPTGEVFNYVGGLKLARNMWHSRAPPRLYIEPPNPLRSVQLRDAGTTVLELAAETFDPGFLAYEKLERDGKTFTVVAKCKTKSSAGTVAFRSADSPRWLGHENAAFLAYNMGTSAGASWGRGATRDKGGTWVAGLTLEGLAIPTAPSCDLATTARIRATYEETEKVELYDSRPTGIDIHTCILRKYHYFIVSDDNVSMCCKDCQSFLWVKEFQKETRRAQKGAAPTIPAGGAETVERPAKQSVPAQISPPPPVPFDVIFDAACYKGFGTWDALRQLLSVSASEPMDLVNSYRALVDLGLIDVEMDENFARPVRWSVPPPALAILEGQKMLLAGFRSKGLIRRVSAALDGFSCEHLVEPQEGAPVVHSWRTGELSTRDITELVSDIVDPFGRRLTVVDSCADRIASAMPFLGTLVGLLRVIHVERVALVEQFEPTEGTWSHARLSAPGGYRTQVHGTVCFYFDGNKCYQASYELVKLLAARLAKTYLHAYDSPTGTFEAMLGCEPPGLFRRALVACSGKLPSKVGGRIVYPGVSKEVANLVLERLYT